jgi:hypothetical protein
MLRRPLRNALLIIHIVVTVAELGTDLALLALDVAGLRGAEARTVYPASHLLGQWLMVPLAVASLTTGLTLSVTTGWKPFVHGWVTLKATITVLLTGLLLASLVPALGRAADAATGAAGAAPMTHAQQTLLVAAPAGAAALLTINVLLGVVKPRLRRPRRNLTAFGDESAAPAPSQRLTAPL